MAGGIFGLLGLIHAHRGAVEYDWRHRFGMGLDEVGQHMTIHEAARLAAALLADPSSASAAALQGWEHPISREAILLADLYDLDHAVAAGGKKVKPHPARPKSEAPVERRGNVAGYTPEEVRAILLAARRGELV